MLHGYKNAHSDTDAIVVACGPSVQDGWSIPDGVMTVGVTTCEAYVRAPDYLMITDIAGRFDADEIVLIGGTRARTVFIPAPRVDSWRFILPSSITPFDFGGDADTRPCDGERLGYSKTSVFPAVLLAEYMGARRIGVIGFDITGHPNLEWRPDVLEDHFGRLTRDLAARGVELWNLSGISALSADVIPRMSTEDFVGVNA